MHYATVKGILSAQNGMNLYRGCTHGCIYCDSRSRCYQMEHAFEDVEVKANALELLEAALRRKRRRCMIGTGSMTDPYMPAEAALLRTRGALELIYKYGFGATLITKSDLVLRDIELLRAINERAKCVVQMTLTVYDEALSRRLEPGVCTTLRRAQVLSELRGAGIPTVVWLSPILPFITDSEENVGGILELCADAGVYGVICFGMGMTLREGNREYYYSQLDRLFPGMKERYIRAYGERYSLESPNSPELLRLLHRRCEAAGMVHSNDAIFSYLSTLEDASDAGQLSLFPDI